MENNELKEKIRKNIKEEIAISNTRKEFGMKTNQNKKLIYAVSSVCAVLILTIGILVAPDILPIKNEDFLIGEAENTNNCEEIKTKVEININKLKELAMTSLDADVQTITMESLPEKFTFMKKIVLPAEYQLEGSYNIYVRSDREVAKYDVLHDYVFNYRKNSTNSITIAFSELEQPLRDYYIDKADKVSKIGDVELIISQWKQMYIVTFEYKGIYFDIETTGITEKELVEMLQSIIQ